MKFIERNENHLIIFKIKHKKTHAIMHTFLLSKKVFEEDYFQPPPKAL